RRAAVNGWVEVSLPFAPCSDATAPFSSARSLVGSPRDVGGRKLDAAWPGLRPRVGVLREAELAEHLFDRDLHLRAVEIPKRNRSPVEPPAGARVVGDVEPYRLAIRPVSGGANLLLKALAQIERIELGLGGRDAVGERDVAADDGRGQWRRPEVELGLH